MANELRLRQNFLGGLIEDNPLTAAATTLTSTSLAAAVAVTTTGYLPIVLDADGVFGEPEVAYITAHTLNATTCTLLRGQEGTVARQHTRDTPWVHGPLSQDFAQTSISRPQGTFLRRYTFDSDIQSWTVLAGTGTITQSAGAAQLATPGNVFTQYAEPSSAANVADGEVYADFSVVTFDAAGVSDFQLYFRLTDINNYYSMAFKRGANSGSPVNEVLFVKNVAGVATGLIGTPTTATGDRPFAWSTGREPMRFFVRFVGSSITCYVNETLVLSARDTSLTTGRMGAALYGGNNGAAAVAMDNVSVYSLPSTWAPVNY